MRIVWIFGVCVIVVGLAQCSRVLSAIGKRVAPAGATNSQIEPSHAKLCTLLGFRSKSGLYLRDSVFKSDAISKDTIVFQGETSRELANVCELADVAVAHVSTLERNTGAEQLLESIGAHVRGMCKSKCHASSLIVLIDGKDTEGKELERSINEIVAETQSFGCSLEVIYRYSGSENESFDVEQVDAIRDTLLSRAIASATRRVKPRSVAELQVLLRQVRETSYLRPAKRLQSPERVEQEKKEFAATEAIKYLPQEYQDRLNETINRVASSTLAAGRPANTTVKALSTAVKQVTTRFSKDHTTLLQNHVTTQAVRTHLPAQCRMIATELLLPLYWEIVRNIRRDAVRQFDKRVERIKGSTPGLPEVLKAFSAATFETFSSQLQYVHDSFAQMVLASESVVDAQVHQPLQTSPSTPSSTTAKPTGSKDLPRLPQFDASFEKYQLLLHMQHTVTEFVHAQSLAGAHNPFVRNYPFPPFHLNFNYLLDPRDFFKSREFARMYDEPSFGPCENRADPLLFDGVAIVPFSPMDQPLRPDPRQLWHKTRDWWNSRILRRK